MWRVQLAAIRGPSNHKWAMAVVGEVVADTQALGKRWTLSFGCSATERDTDLDDSRWVT